MFNTTLRKRPRFAPILPSLLSSKSPQWLEKSLETHDIAIPLPRTNSDSKPDFFRLLLLSESDGFDEEVLGRIDRLCCVTGGRGVGIVFLLRESEEGQGQGQAGSSSGMMAYLRLQAWLLTSPLQSIPLIPLSTLTSLPQTIQKFHASLLGPRPVPKPINPIRDLLPYCCSDPPMAAHTANVLSDVCGSFRELAGKGREELGEWVGEENVEGVVGFWEVEVYAGG